MKKHLHGKRYMYSRASVKVGRINRRIRKTKRLVTQLNRVAVFISRVNWKVFFANVSERINKIIREQYSDILSVAKTE